MLVGTITGIVDFIYPGKTKIMKVMIDEPQYENLLSQLNCMCDHFKIMRFFGTGAIDHTHDDTDCYNVDVKLDKHDNVSEFAPLLKKEVVIRYCLKPYKIGQNTSINVKMTDIRMKEK